MSPENDNLFFRLPIEIFDRLLRFLDGESVLTLSLTCKELNTVIGQNLRLWKYLALTKHKLPPEAVKVGYKEAVIKEVSFLRHVRCKKVSSQSIENFLSLTIHVFLKALNWTCLSHCCMKRDKKTQLNLLTQGYTLEQKVCICNQAILSCT